MGNLFLKKELKKSPLNYYCDEIKKKIKAGAAIIFPSPSLEFLENRVKSEKFPKNLSFSLYFYLTTGFAHVIMCSVYALRQRRFGEVVHGKR